MGFWAGIKHALNSTLGTENFQPLDKIIKGQRTLAASDNVVAVISLGTSGSYVREGNRLPGVFISKTTGVVRIIVKGTRASSYATSTVIIYKDDLEEVGGLTFQETVNGGNTQILSVNIPVSKGAEYSFKVTYGSLSCDYIYLGAQIVDGSLFEVKETT